MKTIASIVCLISFVWVSLSRSDDSKETKMIKELQSTWICVSSEVNGITREEKASKSQSIIFKENSCTQKDTDTKETLKGTFKIDFSGQQPELSTTYKFGTKEITIRYLFELDKDTLKMCCHLVPGKGIPKEFSGAEGTRQTYLVFKRSRA